MKKRSLKRIAASLLIGAVLLQAAGCGSAEPSGDQPGHGKWINSMLPENQSVVGNQRLEDDFAAAVDAEWLSTQTYNPTEGGNGAFVAVSQDVKRELRELLDDNSKTDPNLEKLRIVDGLYTDWDYRDRLGVEPLRKYLGYIDEITSVEDVYQYMMDFSRNPMGSMLFTPEIFQSDHFALRISQPKYSLQLSNRYGSLGDDGLMRMEQRTAAIRYLMNRMGYSEGDADDLMKENYAFELKMAELSTGGEQMFDYETEISLAELESCVGDFPIRRILERFGLDRFEGYLVDMDYMRGMSSVCTEKNLEGIRAYFKVALMAEAVKYLDKDIFVKYLELKADKANPFSEVVLRTPDVYFFSFLETSALSGLKDQVYLDYYYDEEVDKDIRSICRAYLDEFRVIIGGKEWISDANKERIYQKLDAMLFNVMKPSNVADYSGVSFISKEKGGSMLDAMGEINRFKLEKIGEKGGMEIPRDFWDIYDSGTSTSSAGSAYAQDRNVFYIYIGILKGDFYSKDMSYEQKLGAIGSVIGHELTHAFDSDGVLNDAYGKRNPIIEGDDMRTFEKKADTVRSYFGKVRSFEGSGYYDGSVDISAEAIADMGGVRCGLNIASKIEGFDYDKFFRAYAGVWKRLQSKSTCVSLIKSDVHPLAYLRVNVTVQQFDEFYETYGIKEGDGMYLAPEERIAVW